MPNGLLTCTDLGKTSVDVVIEIDLQGFLSGGEGEGLRHG
jgi:hypothetical protein